MPRLNAGKGTYTTLYNFLWRNYDFFWRENFVNRRRVDEGRQKL